MSLGEVLPEVQSLSRMDKIKLIQFLAQELERDESGLIEPFTAAAVLLQALEDDRPASRTAESL